jgi:hypothetical protein
MYDYFATKLKELEDAPEPLRSAVGDALRPTDAVKLHIVSPEERSVRGASILAVLGTGWIVAQSDGKGQVETTRAIFEETIFVELSRILLHGRLKIAFAGEDPLILDFNAVMTHLYLQAVGLILDGIDDRPDAPHIEDTGGIANLPLKFANAVRTYRPSSQKIIDVLNWSTTYSGRFPWKQDELFPQGMIALTDRSLVCIFEESRRRWEFLRNPKYGVVVTYCPLARVWDCELEQASGVAHLRLRMSASGVEEDLGIMLPPDKGEALQRLLERTNLH